MLFLDLAVELKFLLQLGKQAPALLEVGGIRETLE
jgi:hypothetical protein